MTLRCVSTHVPTLDESVWTRSPLRSRTRGDVEVDLLAETVEVVVAESDRRVQDGLDDSWKWKLHKAVALRVADEVVGVAVHKDEAAMRGDDLCIQQTEYLLEEVWRPCRASTWLDVDGPSFSSSTGGASLFSTGSASMSCTSSAGASSSTFSVAISARPLLSMLVLLRGCSSWDTRHRHSSYIWEEREREKRGSPCSGLERGRWCGWEKVRARKAIIVSAPSSLPLWQALGTQAESLHAACAYFCLFLAWLSNQTTHGYHIHETSVSSLALELMQFIFLLFEDLWQLPQKAREKGNVYHHFKPGDC